MRGALGVFMLSSMLLGCSSNPNNIPGPTPGQFAAAAQFSREHGGRAMLVIVGNQTVFSDNQNNGSIDTPYQIFSGTKSFNCALANVAVQDGLLTSFDEVVANTITEWQTDPKKSVITVRQLLNFTSGVSETLLNLALFAENGFAFNAAIPVLSTPGTRFQYGESSIAVFEELMARKLVASAQFTGLDPLAYLTKRVFGAIGLQPANWLRDSRGQPFLSFGAVLSATQWAKYGQLLRDKGAFNGNQILTSALVDQCTTGSAANAGYGMNLWLNAAMPQGFTGFQLAQFTTPSFTSGGPSGLLYSSGLTDLFAAVGIGDNRMYVIRDNNMVVVRIGSGGLVSEFDDNAFLRALFGS